MKANNHNRLATTLAGAQNTSDQEQRRVLRGLAIAASGRIKQVKDGYSVPSDTRNVRYLVNLEAEPYCSCDYFDETGQTCKHIYAVQIALGFSDGIADADMAEKAAALQRFPRDWAAYNNAQTHEWPTFLRLLHSLCRTAEEPPQTAGRRRMPLAAVIMGLGIKVYLGKSARTSISATRQAFSDVRLGALPSFPTLIRYLGNPTLTPVLEYLIQLSALPLAGVEVDFAADSTGLTSNAKYRWQEHKYGKAVPSAKWTKLHVMCGVLTNIVTVAIATANPSGDAAQLPSLVDVTNQHFRMREVSADKAYSSKRNLHAIDGAGAVAYIPFGSRARARPKNMNSKDYDPLWEKTYHRVAANRDEFNRHYHKRSNVETTFSMIDAKFGKTLKAKTPVAQVNEVLLKVLCHNLCVLAKAMYTLGIEPEFKDVRQDGTEAA